ncbi:septal ring lytic transglycosylase RlpA family protein [candidate division TA06 bacterium]|uniref:Probable endolytic peptidoglycan transglycosylase RlpA n=1 Tax=candidate division TA06 bacterium TaxID=2250710 RepID=A0A933ML36_UNCT6|nr:septal ring lytic transglycosylase RlpA family protein [candidate division TA06 bacterium]
MKKILWALLITAVFFGCTPAPIYRSGTVSNSPLKETAAEQKAQPPAKTEPGPLAVQQGLASYYGQEFHGRKTANGEIFDMQAMTAAHRTLPFGTTVKVTNLKNEQSVTVRINDRGPFVEGRIIDLSQGAAKKIGIDGVEPVRLEIIQQPDK